MSYDDIIAEIESQLDGTPEHDIPFLMDMTEKYSNHELSKEITRACGRMIANVIPEEDLTKIMSALQDDHSKIDDIVQRCHEARMEGDFAKADQILRPCAEELWKAEQNGVFAEDSESVYFDFHNAFELTTYLMLNKPVKTVRETTEPFSHIYMLMGSISYDLGNHDEAAEWITRAIKWCPSCPALYFELSENYKVRGDWQKTKEYAMMGYPYITQGAELAKLLRIIGFCCIEEKQYKLAASAFVVSLLYERNEAAMHELAYMKFELGEDYLGLEWQEGIQELEAAGLPCFAHPNTVMTLQQLIRSTLGHEDRKELAAECCWRMWEFSKDVEYRQMAEDLVGIQPTE